MLTSTLDVCVCLQGSRMDNSGSKTTFTILSVCLVKKKVGNYFLYGKVAPYF